MKYLFIFLFILPAFCYSQSGIYNFNTSEFSLTPNYQTGILILTNIPTDTLDIIVIDQISKEYKVKRRIINKDTIHISTKSYKFDSYLFRITKGKDSIFRKYISVAP